MEITEGPRIRASLARFTVDELCTLFPAKASSLLPLGLSKAEFTRRLAKELFVRSAFEFRGGNGGA